MVVSGTFGPGRRATTLGWPPPKRSMLVISSSLFLQGLHNNLRSQTQVPFSMKDFSGSDTNEEPRFRYSEPPFDVGNVPTREPLVSAFA